MARATASRRADPGPGKLREKGRIEEERRLLRGKKRTRKGGSERKCEKICGKEGNDREAEKRSHDGWKVGGTPRTEKIFDGQVLADVTGPGQALLDAGGP